VPTALVQVRHVTNAGATLGLGAQHPAIVLGLGLAATTVVVWWLARVTGTVERVAVAVLLGGAVGNLVDRVMNGAVTDWIHVAWYPAPFNLADVAIRGGALVAVAAHVWTGSTNLNSRMRPEEGRRMEAMPDEPGFGSAPRSRREFRRTRRT
jgi:signal peptidase II